MTVLVIGGSGFIGRHVVAEFLKHGHQATILRRRRLATPDTFVETIVADRHSEDSLAKAVGNRRFEVIVDCAYDWQNGTTAAQVAVVAQVCPPSDRYVFLSSVGAYGSGYDRTEDDALAPDDFLSPYGRNKAMAERALKTWSDNTGIPVVMLRPTFVYGPYNAFYRESFFWDRMLSDRPIVVPGDGSRLVQFVFVGDLARAVTRSVTLPQAAGQAFNISSAPPITQAQLVDSLAKAAGQTVRTVHVPRQVIEARLGASAHSLYFGERLDLPPITQVAEKWKAQLNLVPTPFLQGLQETFNWHLAHNRRRTLDTAFEDRLLREQRCTALH